MDTPSAKPPRIVDFIHDAAILDCGDLTPEQVNALVRDYFNTPPLETFNFGPFRVEVLKSRHMPPGVAMMLDKIDLRKLTFPTFDPSDLMFPPPSAPFFLHGTETGRFRGGKPRDPEKFEATKAIFTRAAEEARAAIVAINERREKERLLALYEQECAHYEAEQLAYAEDKAPALLVNVHPGVTDIGERMKEAVNMAKALYRTLNAAPVHPFPPPTDEEKQAMKEAQEALLSARRVNCATEVVLAIKDSGGDGGEIDVTVDGKRFRVTAQPIGGELLEARTTGDEQPAPTAEQ